MPRGPRRSAAGKSQLQGNGKYTGNYYSYIVYYNILWHIILQYIIVYYIILQDFLVYYGMLLYIEVILGGGRSSGHTDCPRAFMF